MNSALAALPVSYQDVADAADRIRPLVVETPLLEVADLSEAIGGRFFVKCENLQRTGSFKLRGGMNALGLAQPRRPGQGRCCVLQRQPRTRRCRGSPSLWGRGHHHHARRRAASLNATTPKRLGPPSSPMTAIRKAGKHLGQKIQAETGAILIPPYDYLPTMVGQGTSAIEVTNQLRAKGLSLDTAIICCGGGGLAGGSALVYSTTFPHAKVWAAEPATHDDTTRSLIAGTRLSNDPDARSICDAIVTPTPGEVTFPILQACGVQGRTASDADVLDAVGFAAKRMKLVVEPGGAIALAVARTHLAHLHGQTVVAYLSGGNIDPEMLARAMTRAS